MILNPYKLAYIHKVSYITYMEAAKIDKRKNPLLEGVPTFRKTFRHIPLVAKQRAAEHGMNVSDYVNWLILEKEKEYEYEQTRKQSERIKTLRG